MFKYILVPATGAATDAPVFATALSVARRFAAHLLFLHVRVDVRDVAAAMVSGDIGGAVGIGEIMDAMEQDADLRQRKAEQAFQDFCAREALTITASPPPSGPSAEWRSETGREPDWLAVHGRVADLLVVGRAREGEVVAMDILEAALMETGRPVLIAPAETPQTISDTVAIAWKDTPEAGRAVAAALPFIAAAKRVVILSVEEGDERTDQRSCERLLHALRWHTQAASVQRLQRNSRQPAEIVLDAAATAGADLLVMGGYSHSRLREVVFGGFTRHMLTDSRLPVLMAH